MSRPSQPVPQGDYIPACRHGSLIVTSGMTPRREGVLQFTGPVRRDQSLEDHRPAVRLACENALAAARGLLAEGESLTAILSLTVYVAAEPGFDAHSKLADFASARLREELGPAGIGARTAVGVATLPGNAPVEIQLIATV
ncbi:RidA family protein [Cereibacter sediminicola]|uniref:RidA family protein n=1 Tax=Cereibacter sediminicola TaxID=2584941 RepID=UPI0011A3CBC5|nr:RidA family protein [Cereibacter sediminicola]